MICLNESGEDSPVFQVISPTAELKKDLSIYFFLIYFIFFFNSGAPVKSFLLCGSNHNINGTTEHKDVFWWSEHYLMTGVGV